MDTELPPHLEEIKDRFLSNLTHGGLHAAERMVQDLAIESQSIHAIASVAQKIEQEAMTPPNRTEYKKLLDTVEMTNGVTSDAINAASRHSYAAFMLGVAKKMH